VDVAVLVIATSAVCGQFLRLLRLPLIVALLEVLTAALCSQVWVPYPALAFWVARFEAACAARVALLFFALLLLLAGYGLYTVTA